VVESQVDIMAAVIEETSLTTADAESLKGTRDSILIRKSRLRRILSGGKIPQGEGSSPFSPSNKALIRQEKKLGTPTSSTTSTSKLTTFYKGDGDEQRKDVVEGTVMTTTGPFVCPATSWNLNEECLLDAFLVLFDEVENHKNKDVNGQFFLSKCEFCLLACIYRVGAKVLTIQFVVNFIL
jgi:hypothetical protein